MLRRVGNPHPNSVLRLAEEIAVKTAEGYIIDSTRAALTKAVTSFNDRVPKMAPLSVNNSKSTQTKVGYQRGRANSRPAVEIKSFDVAAGNTNFTAAGIVVPLNTIVAGTDFYQRVGRKVYMNHLHIRGFVSNAATATQDYGRILLIYDSQPNAALPVKSDILQDSTAAAGTSAFSQLNLNNRERFNVLKDYALILPAVTNTAGVLTNGPVIMDPIRNTFNINWNIKMKGLETVYNAANGGTIADVTSGALYIFVTSNGTNNQWSLTWSSRLRYKD